jgi:hypothetical protein
LIHFLDNPHNFFHILLEHREALAVVVDEGLLEERIGDCPGRRLARTQLFEDWGKICLHPIPEGAEAHLLRLHPSLAATLECGHRGFDVLRE